MLRFSDTIEVNLFILLGGNTLQNCNVLVAKKMSTIKINSPGNGEQSSKDENDNRVMTRSQSRKRTRKTFPILKQSRKRRKFEDKVIHIPNSLDS